MGKSHSLDIRERVVAMVRRDILAERPRQGRPPGSGKLAAYRRFLMAQDAATPDMHKNKDLKRGKRI